MRFWSKRLRDLASELWRFGLVGGLSYVVDVGVFNVGILFLNWPWLAAKTVSTIIAATLAFFGNRYWTWRERPWNPIHREYARYFVYNAIGLGIALGCLWVNQRLAEVWPGIFGTALAANIAANVVGVGLGTAFRFYAYRRWVFSADPATKEVVDPEQ